MLLSKHFMSNSNLYKILQLFYGEIFNKQNSFSTKVMRIVSRTPLKKIFYIINIYFNKNDTLKTTKNKIFINNINPNFAYQKLISEGIFTKFKIKNKIINKINQSIKNKKFLINRSKIKKTIDNKLTSTYVMRYHNPHLEIKEVYDITFNEQIISIVKKYLKCNPIVQSTQIWWTFPFYNKNNELDNPPGNEFGFHYDVDDYKFLKLFIYLNNVTLKNGPHVYITNNGIKNWPEYLDRRISDDEVKKKYKKRIKVLIGKMGQGFIEDPSFYHKGTNPTEPGGRCLLQVVYSINKWQK